MNPDDLEMYGENPDLLPEEKAYLEDIEEDEVHVMRAMSRAKQAFQAYFDEIGYDCAYFRLQLATEIMDSSFEEVLEKITWEDQT